MWRRSGMDGQVKQAPDLISRNCCLCEADGEFL